MSSHSERIIALIGEISPYEDIGEDTQLIESGIIDSLSLVILISLLEEEFDVEINEEEFVAVNFASVSAIERLIRKIVQ